MAGTAVADVADGADEPIVRAGRIGDHETVGLGIPNRAIGSFPTVAGARFTGVLGIEILPIYSDVVPDGGSGPTMMGTGFGVDSFGSSAAAG